MTPTIAIIQSCLLACPVSMMEIRRHAIEDGRWIEAWECLVKTLGSFEDPFQYEPLKAASDGIQLRSNVDYFTIMPRSDDQECTAVSARLNAGGAQIQNTSTPFDAGCASASSPDVSHKHHSIVSLPLPESSITHLPDSCPNDMIRGPVANASDYIPEQPPVGSHLVCEEDSQSYTLLELRLDGRNIVLDSSCPHIAPHIVITPPVSYADDFYTPHQNRVDLQWPCNLNVPRLPPHMFYHHCPLPSPHDESADYDSKKFESQSVTDESGGAGPGAPGAPPRVFNPQKLLSTVETSSTERLIFREVVDGIFRHRRKAVAFEASLSASAACAQFNQPGAASHLEQPFVWTDPAQPILLASRYFSGISIIESDCPFKAPHIMITDAPPHDPWISWGNRVEDQDYDYLPVYPKRDSSESPSPSPSNSALEAASGPGPQLHHKHPDAFSIEPHSNHSREPHLIDIPSSSLDDSGRFLMDLPHETCELGCGPCSDHPRQPLDVNALPCSLEDISTGRAVIRCETPTPPCFDEEDDLPPLDDWYLKYLTVIDRSEAVGA
ncbi:hypothetical protein K503DRAFT_778792 [Rhizopogon vinicolor AM-OR11-026]|uniref:Uncharacterized protein n=1 Tax=Rhizopogon vinicolor AM-OR11-026 TaxID=1314800 RepID=A0A1B7NGY1_9AGAM|nr:hypothetical protein K503DRAFT_778792 [Rhizopogon vinicolor AM-OR11-026]